MLTGNWLSSLCNDIEKQYNIEISDYARELILQAAIASQFDPHPAWARNKPDIDKIQELISEQLVQLAQSESARERHVITYFHILHWLAENVIILRAFPVPKDD